MTDFSFKPLAMEHLPLLHQWMQEPHLQPWWGEGREWSLEEIEKKYSSYVLGYKLYEKEKKALSAFVIEHAHHPVGYIQYYDISDFPQDFLHLESLIIPSQPAAAIDFYICEKYLGMGWGAEILKEFLAYHLFQRFDVCLVDPDKRNKSAIKSYSKAGFNTLQETDEKIVMAARKDGKKNPIVIIGSSRGDGHTQQAIQTIVKDTSIPIIDLKDLVISHYDYKYENSKDDFLPLAEKMIQYNPIILATPVYWYTMSALMKTFIDRWSDLLDIRKDIGRRLAGKELFVVTSYGNEMPRGFEEPFIQTCEYLEITYKGCFYFYSGNDPERQKDNLLSTEKFSHDIFN